MTDSTTVSELDLSAYSGAELAGATAEALEILIAERAIRRVLQNYCRGIDRLDRALLRATWHPGATVDYVGFFTGSAEELTAIFLEHHLKFIAHSHQITNVTVKIAGDQAVSETYVTARLRKRHTSARSVDHVIAGRYLDRWSKRQEVWAIDHRLYHNDVNSAYEVVDGMETTSSRDRTDPAYALFASIGA